MDTTTTTAPAAQYPTTKRGAAKFLNAALRMVESKRIRAWAKSEHNRPVWEGEALRWLRMGRRDITRFSTIILAEAIGL